MNESNNPIIQTITYISVERIMDWYEQKQKKTIHRISLHADAISTTNRTFKLEQIHDISYRPFSGNTGLFYLHTNQGVFTYEVDTDPNLFIRAYKKLRGDYGY